MTVHSIRDATTGQLVDAEPTLEAALYLAHVRARVTGRRQRVETLAADLYEAESGRPVRQDRAPRMILPPLSLAPTD